MRSLASVTVTTQDHATTSARCHQMVIWCVSIAVAPSSSTYLCAPQLSISLILDLRARLQVITYTNLIGSTHAIYGEAGHAPTCTYRLLSLPICPLDSHNIALSHYFPACSDEALNPPCIITSATRLRRHAFIAGVAVSTSCQPKHRPRSTINCPRRTTGPSKSPSTSSTCTTPALRHL